MSDFLMPSLGADMEAARVVEWLVGPGDTLKRGDVIAVVETDKGAIEIEVFADCVVEELVVPVGTEVKVDGVLAHLRSAAAAAPARAAVPLPVPPSAIAGLVPVTAAPALVTAVPMMPAPVAFPGRPRASPAARVLARELQVDLALLTGTGIGGAISRADVERAAAARKPAARKPRGGFDPAAMRRAIAAAMSRAKREIPHYYLSQTIALGPALAWLARENLNRPVSERLLPAALLLKATGLALKKVPELNGFFDAEGFRPGPGVHIGWAVSLRGGGLLAPAIHDVDRQSVSALMAALRDVVQRARTGGLRSSELMDPTITVTSLGERSAESVLPIIHPPQVAVIGFGSIVERPWVTGGAVAVQPVVSASLAADHRVSDGHRGGLLLAEIDQRLQRPELL